MLFLEMVSGLVNKRSGSFENELIETVNEY